MAHFIPTVSYIRSRALHPGKFLLTPLLLARLLLSPSYDNRATLRLAQSFPLALSVIR